MTDVALNKKASIERCLQQARTYYQLPSSLPFAQDYLRQDAIALNLQRACEQAIDLANHVVKQRKLGLPKESREAFTLLETATIIPPDLSRRLKAMIGFRNVIVHSYQQLDLDIMTAILEHHGDDLITFSNLALQALGGQ